MNANDLIECYVADVAARLPRKQRNDVAFELRALLHEELQSRADSAGRGADAAMATDFLRSFGPPDSVAARYRPTFTVIDPADGPAFVRATAIGLAIIWGLGLVSCLLQPIESGTDLLRAIGQWWGATVLPSPWWPGVLVVGFGLASWIKRRWPHTTEWKPRAADRIVGGRMALGMALAGVLVGLIAIVNPSWVLHAMFGGRAAPAAYEALTYAETFRHRQAPWLLILISTNVPLFVTVIVMGRWSPLMRRIQLALGLMTCAVMIWTVLDGPIFIAPSSDRTVKAIMVLIVAFLLISWGVKRHRSVQPKPIARLRT